MSAFIFLLRSLRLLPNAVSVRSKVELEKSPLKSVASPDIAIVLSKLLRLSVTFCTSKSPELISITQV